MTTRHRFHANRTEGYAHQCTACDGTGKHEATGRCIACDGTGKVVTPLTREDRVQLGQVCTNNDGKHFTELYDCDWLDAMERIGLLTIHRPRHDQTGIPYSSEYWSVEVAPEVADWFDECGELIED